MRPPPVDGWPPGTGTTRPPPRSRLELAPGDRRGTTGSPPLPSPPPSPPLSPPGPRTAGGRPGGRRPRTPPPPGLGGDPPPPPPPPPPPGRAATPRGGRHCRSKRCCTPSASSRPPTHSRSARGRPAALRRRSRAPCGPQRDGSTRTCAKADPSPSLEGGAQTKRPTLVPARGGRRNRPQQGDLPAPRPAGPPGRAPEGGRRTDHPRPPPGRLTHRRPARPRPAPGAAKRPRPNTHTWGGCASEEGGSGPGATGHPPGGGRWGTTARLPLPSPPTTPLRPAGRQKQATGAPDLNPPQGRGDVPPPPERAAAPGEGTLLSLYATRPQAPTCLLQ